MNDKFPKWLNCKCGMHAEVMLTRGKEHECLSMMFTLRDNKFVIDVTGKAKDILDKFPIKFKDNKSEKTVTPTSADMFDAVDSKYLSAEKRELFHQIAAQNIFISKRGGQDIQPIIAVLCAQA